MQLKVSILSFHLPQIWHLYIILHNRILSANVIIYIIVLAHMSQSGCVLNWSEGSFVIVIYLDAALDRRMVSAFAEL